MTGILVEKRGRKVSGLCDVSLSLGGLTAREGQREREGGRHYLGIHNVKGSSSPRALPKLACRTEFAKRGKNIPKVVLLRREHARLTRARDL